MLYTSSEKQEERFGLELFEGQYQEVADMILASHCGIKEVRTKLEILSDEMQLQYSRNPIESIKSRIKSIESIAGKLRRRGQPLTVEAARQELFDIAGVRVICSFVDDVYRVAHMLAMQSDVKLLVVKDYIRNPKPNGYRSYHMIMEVPVFFSNHTEPVKVEVQIRTIAMDFWATLEHQLNYKKDLQGSDEILHKLTACAESIAEVDKQMQEIREMVEQLGGPVGNGTTPAQNLRRLFG